MEIIAWNSLHPTILRQPHSRLELSLVATGAKPQRLYISGEEEFWGRGVSYSAHSHAPLFRGRDVAIVGYGNSMIVIALKLASIAKHVYLFPTMALLESDERVQMMKNDPKVSFMTGWHIQCIEGNDAVSQIVSHSGWIFCSSVRS